VSEPAAQTLTGGQAITRSLERHGVDTVFGIPGKQTLALYAALAGSTIRHVTARHEQAAGYMADGYARASGRPSVCVVVTGPGLTNVATPLAQAYADSVPLLVLAGQIRSD
jgi:5-guanidino-2-oxopentanoate decarboxylase